MTPVLSLPDLLVFLPYHVGFALRDALVMLALDGSRLALVARADLPRSGPLPEATRARMVGGLRRLPRLPDAVVVAAYVEEASATPALDDLLGAVARVGPSPRAVVVRSGWWCDPEEGEWEPLPHPADVPLVAEYVGRGIAPVASRESLVASLAADPSPSLAASVAALTRAGVDARTGLAAWERLRRSADRADAGADVEEAVATTLAFLADTGHRDLLLADLVPLSADRATACDGIARPGTAPCGEGERAGEGCGDRGPSRGGGGDDGGGGGTGRCRGRDPEQAGGGGANLDLLAVRAAERAALLRLVRSAPPHLRATALSVLALWSWHSGDGATAAVASSAALVEDPGYSLAAIVAHLVELDVPSPGLR